MSHFSYYLYGVMVDELHSMLIQKHRDYLEKIYGGAGSILLSITFILEYYYKEFQQLVHYFPLVGFAKPKYVEIWQKVLKPAIVLKFGIIGVFVQESGISQEYTIFISVDSVIAGVYPIFEATSNRSVEKEDISLYFIDNLWQIFEGGFVLEPKSHIQIIKVVAANRVFEYKKARDLTYHVLPHD